MAAAIAPVVSIEQGRQSASLYEIVDHLSALYDTLDLVETPEERAAIEADIAAYEVAEIRKVDSVAGYLAHCEAQQKFAAEEIKRLQERKKTWERRQERLEDSIQRTLVAIGKTSLDGRTSTLALKKCPASVEVLDLDLVPMEYIRRKIEDSVDKTAAKPDLIAGVEIPGLKLITDKKSVVRK